MLQLARQLSRLVLMHASLNLCGCRLEELLRALEAKMSQLARQLSDCEAHRRKFEVRGFRPGNANCGQTTAATLH